MSSTNHTTLLVLVLIMLPAVAVAQDVILGRQVAPSSRFSIEDIDHQTWDRLLKEHVNDRGEVDYRHWKDSTKSVRALDAYLTRLSVADPNIEASRNARMAFWINAYNAVTVRGILREYPTTSIRNHTAKLFGYNIWKNLKLIIGGRSYSLDQMEHDILRKMREPKIHFAIVCASRGCPRLLNEAFRAEQLQDQLDRNTTHFFSLPQNFQYIPSQKKMRVSSILKWFGDDFGDSQAKRLETIAPYLPTDDAKRAAAENEVSLSYLDYDWSLNDQRADK